MTHDSSLKDTEEETGDHDVGKVLGPDHDEDHDTPDKGGTTENTTRVPSTEEVRPSGLSDHVTANR